MANFLRLTLRGTGQPVLINTELVTAAMIEASGTRLYFTDSADDHVDVTESLDVIAKTVGACNAEGS